MDHLRVFQQISPKLIFRKIKRNAKISARLILKNYLSGTLHKDNHEILVKFAWFLYPIYIWLESALHSIFLLWMSRNEGQSLCSHSLNFELLSKSFGIYLYHTSVSPQNFGKSSTHQKSPFLEESTLGNGLSVRSSPHIHIACWTPGKSWRINWRL